MVESGPPEHPQFAWAYEYRNEQIWQLPTRWQSDELALWARFALTPPRLRTVTVGEAQELEICLSHPKMFVDSQNGGGRWDVIVTWPAPANPPAADTLPAANVNQGVHKTGSAVAGRASRGQNQVAKPHQRVLSRFDRRLFSGTLDNSGCLRISSIPNRPPNQGGIEYLISVRAKGNLEIAQGIVFAAVKVVRDSGGSGYWEFASTLPYFEPTATVQK